MVTALQLCVVAALLMSVAAIPPSSLLANRAIYHASCTHNFISKM
jgi:hypothetical protein